MIFIDCYDYTDQFDANSLTTPTTISSHSERVVDLTEDNESVIDLTVSHTH